MKVLKFLKVPNGIGRHSLHMFKAACKKGINADYNVSKYIYFVRQ